MLAGMIGMTGRPRISEQTRSGVGSLFGTGGRGRDTGLSSPWNRIIGVSPPGWDVGTSSRSACVDVNLYVFTNSRDEIDGYAVSPMNFVVSVIQHKSRANGRPISMSATMRERATIYCTMYSLQICFLLCEKSMRQNPPPGARITFRGSRSSCSIPIL